ncbi:diaminopimelate dehydrogenase [Ammoniphilus oxalaticus]|uniref:Meso-diaminopimelate D-dehydrogenase n=1 Tax=Ammoniphilus oxalaticus TaxID=66863 RepID=A0A419SG30_9BACL|nr:diaminopimelate dehydrogenase [Ammoniphilus oxalaticus]RKD22715.1 diaminopimelate dehydrogenase [Ammoniphilus oxalaticus]
MGEQIRIGIIGYGNLGRGVESAIKQNEDMSLVAVFSRRDPASVDVDDPQVKVASVDDIEQYTDAIDVMILCGGSATDLPEQGPTYAKLFNTIDSFDNHGKIPEYFESVDKSAKPNQKTSIIAVGWDPGLFSLNRLMGEAVLPKGTTYTFWGKGLSQGHSDAVRRVAGVKGGVQYTLPSEEAIQRVRDGEDPDLSTRDRHKRECYVVAEAGADLAKIEQDIKTMPNYFADYDTTVHFITEEQLKKEHAAMPHGGFVIRSGKTGKSNNNQIVEFSLKLGSNPEFTSSALVAYARAAYRMSQEGLYGAKTIYDVAPGYVSPKTAAELRKELL